MKKEESVLGVGSIYISVSMLKAVCLDMNCSRKRGELEDTKESIEAKAAHALQIHVFTSKAEGKQ